VPGISVDIDSLVSVETDLSISRDIEPGQLTPEWTSKGASLLRNNHIGGVSMRQNGMQNKRPFALERVPLTPDLGGQLAPEYPIHHIKTILF
jgi:hypothetical protein